MIQAPDPIKQKLEARLTLREGDRITLSPLNDLSQLPQRCGRASAGHWTTERGQDRIDDHDYHARIPPGRLISGRASAWAVTCRRPTSFKR